MIVAIDLPGDCKSSTIFFYFHIDSILLFVFLQNSFRLCQEHFGLKPFYFCQNTKGYNYLLKKLLIAKEEEIKTSNNIITSVIIGRRKFSS